MFCHADKPLEGVNVSFVAEQNIQLWKELNYLRAENYHYRAVINNLSSMVTTKEIKEEPMDPVATIKEPEIDDGNYTLYL